jgi:hypothetical protein
MIKISALSLMMEICEMKRESANHCARSIAIVRKYLYYLLSEVVYGSGFALTA